MNWQTFESRVKDRDRKLRRRRSSDMVVSNRSIKTTIVPTIVAKAKAAKEERKRAKQRIDRHYRNEQDPDDGYGTRY